MPTTYYTTIDSPVGELLIPGDGKFVTGLYMPNHKHGAKLDNSWIRDDRLFSVIHEQLAEYFSGERQEFDVPLKFDGTPFQKRVWDELVRIPFGTTITYGELARRVDQPTAFRAVGNANGRNPVSILVPCHRVIGTNGKLTGYGGGMANKKWLLAWERSVKEGNPGSPRTQNQRALSFT